MKKWIGFIGILGILISIMILAFACRKEAGYRIYGSVPETPDGIKAYLYDWNTPVDSAVVQGGKFVLKGKVDIPVRYQLWIDLSPELKEDYRKDLRGTNIFMDNTDIRYESPSIDSLPSRLSFTRKVKGNVTITGSPAHDLYMSYQKDIKSYKEKKSEAWDKYLQVYHIPASDGIFNTREGIALAREMESAQKEIERVQKEFVKAHPNSPVAVNVAQDMVYGGSFSKTEMEGMLKTIDVSLHNTPAYQQLKESIEGIFPTAIGEKYTDINLVDEVGKEVKLSDYVKPGQYNMVEFWASWCGPCRGEIPHLRHVYDAYGKGKDGLNMISVSVDEREKDWKKAIQEENMEWTQLCDMKGFKGDVAIKYKVQGVPFCLILDKEGKIIAREVRGSELDIVLIDHLGDRYEK